MFLIITEIYLLLFRTHVNYEGFTIRTPFNTTLIIHLLDDKLLEVRNNKENIVKCNKRNGFW